jgi:hypothetical protein
MPTKASPVHINMCGVFEADMGMMHIRFLYKYLHASAAGMKEKEVNLFK